MSEEDCMKKALDLLAVREHNKAEMRKKLIERGAEAETADTVISKLTEKGLLSEYRYAVSFIRSSNRRHPEGKSIVLMRLLQKGTDRNTAREALEDVYSVQYVNELIERVVAKTDAENVKLRLHKLGFSQSDLRNCYDDK